MNLDRFNIAKKMIGYPTGASSGTRASIALDSAYVHLTSGDAIAIRYQAHVAASIDELYVFVDDVAGSLSANPMQCDIYNENASYADRPGSTLRDSSTACTTPTADKWAKFTFGSPYTPTVGEILWLVIYNTDAAPGTNYPSILYATTIFGSERNWGPVVPYYTANGYSSAGASAIEMPFVIVQSSAYVGQPFTQAATTYSSNTLERGIQFTPTEDLTVVGASWFAGSVAYADLRLLADATAPGGSALYTWDLDSDANETTCDLLSSKFFDSAVTLTGGTTYKLTLTYSGNYSNPAAMQIEDYASYGAMFDALRAQDTLSLPWSVIDNGSGGWTTDKSICPNIGLIISDFPLQPSGPRFGDRTGGLR